MALGNHAAALDDAEKAARGGNDWGSTAPMGLNNSARRLRAQALFNLGRWKDAVDQYDELIGEMKGAGDRAFYLYYFREIALWKMGRSDPALLRDALRLAWKETWPVPVGHFLAGTTDAAGLARAASDSAAQQQGSSCEAPFYIAEMALKQGDMAGARAGFQRTLMLCHPGMFERWAAESELTRMSKQRP